MSLTLELLRTETDREPLFWAFNGGNGLISAVPHDCPKANKKANTTANNSTTADTALVNNNNNVRNGLSQDSKRHSYYECCVNVEVSALLEHWLGWDDKHHCHGKAGQVQANNAKTTSNAAHHQSNINNNTTKSWADRLVSFLVGDQRQFPPTEDENEDEDPSIWVRKFCSEVGCDVLKKQDTNGKTLLHHLLSGAVKRNLASTAMILLESGVPSDLPDSQGDTPLHLIRNLISVAGKNRKSSSDDSYSDQPQLEEICHLVSVLVHQCANNVLDQADSKGRTLLSYAVEAGDRYVSLTRLLVNLGAKTFSDHLGHQSAFAWFLRAHMRKMGAEVAIDEETFYVLSHAIHEEVGGSGLKFKAILDRNMVALGSSPEAHGPLFRRIRGLAAHFWLQPPQLRLLAVKSIRRSMGPKRLSSKEVIKRLKVPRKLQRFVTLEEKIPLN